MRREFGISAYELFEVLPAWEVDVLVEKWNDELRERKLADQRANRRR